MIHVRNMILAPQSMNGNETKTHKSMTNSLDLGLTTLHLDVYSSWATFLICIFSQSNSSHCSMSTITFGRFGSFGTSTGRSILGCSVPIDFLLDSKSRSCRVRQLTVVIWHDETSPPGNHKQREGKSNTVSRNEGVLPPKVGSSLWSYGRLSFYFFGHFRVYSVWAQTTMPSKEKKIT